MCPSKCAERRGMTQYFHKGSIALASSRLSVAVGLALALTALPELLEGDVAAVPSQYLGLLVLQELVGLEEGLDLAQPVRPDLLERLIVREARIVLGDGENLEVAPGFVGHVDPAERTSL